MFGMPKQILHVYIAVITLAVDSDLCGDISTMDGFSI